MPRFLLPLALVAAVAVALSAALAAPPARADALSQGCTNVNTFADIISGTPLHGAGLIGDFSFTAGEEITATAKSPPSSGSPTTVSFKVNGSLEDSTTYPGTVSYVIPVTGTYNSVFWSVDDGNVLWAVSCTAPPPDPAQEIADLQDTVTSFGLPKGLTTALNAKLQAALGYLAADDTADACDTLTAFLHQVRAQSGKKLSEEQAQELTDAATAIQADLGC